MENKSTPAEPVAKPSFAEQFQDVIASLTGDLHCKSCHGRFYLGVNKVQVTKGGALVDQLQLCHCAKIEETKLIQLAKEVANIRKELSQLNGLTNLFAERLRLQNDSLDMIFVHTFWGFPRTVIANISLGIRRGWKALMQKIRKPEKVSEAAPSTPQVQK